MNGSGKGATYDRNLEVLWILDAADVTFQGGVRATARTKVHCPERRRPRHRRSHAGTARLDGKMRQVVKRSLR